ncbi:MAG: tyrosine-type recombinase/integrase [Spirochaetales bacterium]|nr:tyrosine-type recombinase/integrase [Spirochaetales bacterium]
MSHILRKTFYTHSLEQGLSLKKVHIMAGHADIRTISRYYSHVVVKPGQFINASYLRRIVTGYEAIYHNFPRLPGLLIN